MKPNIEGTSFGSITIDGKIYAYDVLIRLDGSVEKRKKKLSKAVYGTSHIISLTEAEHIFEEGVKVFILGAGQYGMVNLSEEAARFFEKHNCEVNLLTTPEAIKVWNEWKGGAIGLFHVTC